MEGLDALLPPETARKAEALGVAKAQQPLTRLITLGVLAGAFIALGAVFSTVATAGGGMAPGIARIVGGVTFSLGLVLVVVAGAELFTGNTLMVMSVASRRLGVGSLVRAWTVVYVANFAGALATAALVYGSGFFDGGDGDVGVRALEIAVAKTSLRPGEAVLLGVLANALVCLAVWLTLSARTVADKVLAVVFPITAFVAAGFEHSIANMYFIPAGLLIEAGDPSWAGGERPTLTLLDFLVGNLLPVTIGNVIGGGVLVGLVYWFAYLREP